MSEKEDPLPQSSSFWETSRVWIKGYNNFLSNQWTNVCKVCRASRDYHSFCNMYSIQIPYLGLQPKYMGSAGLGYYCYYCQCAWAARRRWPRWCPRPGRCRPGCRGCAWPCRPSPPSPPSHPPSLSASSLYTGQILSSASVFAGWTTLTCKNWLFRGELPQSGASFRFRFIKPQLDVSANIVENIALIAVRQNVRM